MWGGLLVSSYHCTSYSVADPFSSLGTFSSSFIRGPVFHSIDEREHPLLYLPGTSIASQEIAISVSCQQNLVSIYNSVWVWWLFMGWIPRWVSLWMVLLLSQLQIVPLQLLPWVFCSSILRRRQVSTFWSSFLSFMCFVNCILGSLSFWATIHLSVNAYHVCSFVFGLPQSLDLR